MKLRNLSITAAAFALAFGLSACGQRDAGAPIAGNKDDWAPRIAQGKPTLYKHALEGFTGNKGTMPPRGGNPSLKDNEVEAAVDFMVAKAH